MSVKPASDEKIVESAKQRIETLKQLRSESVITEEEYTARREQIINELTGTTGHSVPQRPKASKTSATVTSSRYGSVVDDFGDFGSTPIMGLEKYIKRNPMGMTQIKKHPPPNWGDNKFQVEKATKIIYNFSSKDWEKEETKIKIEMKPFDQGGLRLVFHLKDMNDPATAYVAKMSRDPRDNKTRDIYYEDVRMQAVAAHFANKFNSYNPPKRIEFLTAFILELVQREGSPLCGVERFITGHYQKYNNNRGWISEDQRNTPLAFCHFTWEVSNRGLLICDIQGVDDVYTDPQIHSRDGEGFGKGNLGQEGINHFIKTHKCNPICKFLNLPKINQLPVIMQIGTVPNSTKMKKQHITQLPGITQMSAPLLQDRYKFPALRKQKPEPSYCSCNVL